MIKIVSYGMEGTVVVVIVKYTTSVGSEEQFEARVQGSQLFNYTVDEIKQWVLNRVAQKRIKDLNDAIAVLLQPLVDVDLETE